MSDRRRRRLEDEGEDETANITTETESTTILPSREGRTRVSECDSEGESGDVELSECESAADEGGDQEEETTEDGSDSETEEGSDTEDLTDSGTETEGGEDYTDEEGLDGERESGDGEEQPDPDKPDDDEDRKNPAYVPRKGAFYEHDFRDGVEGEEEVEAEAPDQTKAKKKLWQDEGKWSHDHYRDEMQAPKSREELIAIYGYDIRAADKPPEVSPRKPRRKSDGPRHERKFRDYLPRMAVIDTTEYGKDTVPNIDEDGLITYDDPVPRNNPRPQGNTKRRGRGGRMQRNNYEDDNEESNHKQHQRYEEKNLSSPYGGQVSEDNPTPQESLRIKPSQGDSGRGRKVTSQADNRNRVSNQDNNRHRETYQDNRYRESNQSDNRYRESNQYNNRYREANQYNDERMNNSHGDSRRGGYRGRGRGLSNYHQSQDVRQHESRMNEDNWNHRDSYDSRKDGRYSNSRNDSRKIIIQDDQNSHRYQNYRDDGNKNYKTQERGYNNRRSPYHGGGGDNPPPPRRSGHDDYNNASKRGNYRGFEQPPRYQQHQSNREVREYTNTSYKGDDRPSGQESVAKPYGASVGPKETGDASNGLVPGKDALAGHVATPGSHVEKKSYAKERRAKGAHHAGDTLAKDRPANASSSVDASGVSGRPQQYVNTSPSVSTETASAPAAGGAKRYSSQRQQGLSKPLPVERGANLYNPALPPPSFYQRDPSKGGQQPSSSSPGGVPDAPHFNPSILPPGSTALPYHLPAVPQPGGIQLAGAAGPPAVFQPTQGPPPPAAPIAAQPRPALIAPPYIPPGMIYGAPAAPPRVPPPGTPAGLSIPFAYPAPPPPNPLPGAAPPAVSQADQIALAGGQQGQQPAGQPKKVYRGDITYYAPELQHPSRTPLKRPKSAIPIVDPQEIRRMKEAELAAERKFMEKADSMRLAASSATHEKASYPGSERASASSGSSLVTDNPKPQRSRPDRSAKEHRSEVREKAYQGATPHSKQANSSSSEISPKDVASSENTNHVNTSSLALGVETMKNEVVAVSREMTLTDKTSVTVSETAPKDNPDPSSRSSRASASPSESTPVPKVTNAVVVQSEEAAA